MGRFPLALRVVVGVVVGITVGVVFGTQPIAFGVGTPDLGPLGMLVNDKETADNLKALIYNMRKSGVLFYKDRAVSESENKNRKTP